MQKTAYEMRISDWSSDVCSSDLTGSALLSDDAERPALCCGDFPIERRRVPQAGARGHAAQPGGGQDRVGAVIVGGKALMRLRFDGKESVVQRRQVAHLRPAPGASGGAGGDAGIDFHEVRKSTR